MSANGFAQFRSLPQGQEEGCFDKFRHSLNRKKTIDANVMNTPLKRCLNTFDITLLGVGHMIGAGIYVLTGEVAKNEAGPAIVFSYIVAGFTSFLAALCYAEFGARVPKAGSAYVYTYVTMGEFFAFVIGWDVVLEHMIGAASVARAWSGYLDGLFHNAIQNGTRHYVGEMHVDYIAETPDFIAFGICFGISIILSVGVKGSSIFNTIFTLINLFIIVFVICVGFYFARGENWSHPPGGFFPFGFNGVIAGAAKCFYAYVGFDSIATSSEEAKNPSKAIPLATFLAMLIATFSYITMSSALTLMIPYNTININAVFPDAFSNVNAEWAKWVVTVGALAGMTTTMFGSLFALPRCIYAMATDGLMFKCFAYVHPKTQTPIITLVTCSFFAALIALLFDLKRLVDFMSIGTLMAYTIVSASVVVLRYQPSSSYSRTEPPPYTSECTPSSDVLEIKDIDNGGRLKSQYSIKLLENFSPGKVPTYTILLQIATIVSLCLLLQFGIDHIVNVAWWAILLLIVFIGLIGATLTLLCMYEHSNIKLIFRVPFVPFLPALSIFCNVYLLTHLEAQAWIRFGVWMLIGFIIYFGYGIWHSVERNRQHTVSTAHLVLPEAAMAAASHEADFTSKQKDGNTHL